MVLTMGRGIKHAKLLHFFSTFRITLDSPFIWDKLCNRSLPQEVIIFGVVWPAPVTLYPVGRVIWINTAFLEGVKVYLPYLSVDAIK